MIQQQHKAISDKFPLKRKKMLLNKHVLAEGHQSRSFWRINLPMILTLLIVVVLVVLLFSEWSQHVRLGSSQLDAEGAEEADFGPPQATNDGDYRRSRLFRRHLELSSQAEEGAEDLGLIGTVFATDRWATDSSVVDEDMTNKDVSDGIDFGREIESPSDIFYIYKPGLDEIQPAPPSTIKQQPAVPAPTGLVGSAGSGAGGAVVAVTGGGSSVTSASIVLAHDNPLIPADMRRRPLTSAGEQQIQPQQIAGSEEGEGEEGEKVIAENKARAAAEQLERANFLNKLKPFQKPNCIGQKDPSEPTLNWLCQGLQFTKVPTDLNPKPMSLRIQQTGLRKWPDFSQFSQQRILNSVDLDNNKITTLGPKPINMRIELLNLEFNHIGSIGELTFNGSEIGILSLSGNRQLTHIHPNAFANLKNLVKLDLSSTSLQQLPTVGLHQLRTLIIRDTYALKRIPSIYVFPVLEDAQLTYAYHCCWFRYPQRHDPTAYEEHLKLQEEINQICADKREQQQQHLHHHHQQQQQSNKSPAAGTIASGGQSNPDFEGFFDDEQKMASSVSSSSGSYSASVVVPMATIDLSLEQIKSAANQRPHQNETAVVATTTATTTTKLKPSTTKTTTRPSILTALTSDNSLVADNNRSGGGGGNDLKKLWLLRDIECGEVAATNTIRNITCTPEPDAFNPCEDIMGYPVLRVAVWFVVGASVFGNLSVIVVLAGIFRRLSVPKFLQLNLAIGDLFMGVYLALLALADLTTVGTYFNYAIDWQHGFGCKVAGAASLFASQLSIFTLSVITFERYYTITYSIDLNMRLQLGWAARIMFVGWLYAFASAMLPIFADINSYSKTSICLPMRTARLLDRVFIFVLLTIDSTAFVIIFACYLKMYLLIIRQKTQATAKERTVAMRMALLVSTDFACWAPIIFFGTTALFGSPLISVTNSKILIVFFYPLNSMANPFLYVISTRQYRRDLNYLTVRWNVWRKNLFRRNRDSCYYSGNNNPYGLAANPYHINSANALNVHLGAVAAVTGVANHLRYNHMGADAADSGKPNCNSNNDNQQSSNPNNILINMHEQRVISTKSHQGRYVIRHQILTEKHSPGGRDGCGGGGGGSYRSGGSRRAQRQPALKNNQCPNSSNLTRDALDNEPDWSGASRLDLAAARQVADRRRGPIVGGARISNDDGAGSSKTKKDKKKAAENGAGAGSRARKTKCRICNTTGSLASCCTRCCCCKSTPVQLAPCGTITTIISGAQTTTQQQPQAADDQPRAAELISRTDESPKQSPEQPESQSSRLLEVIVATGDCCGSGGGGGGGDKKTTSAAGAASSSTREDSSVTFIGGTVSSHTEATSSFSNYSTSLSQFDVPPIKIRGYGETGGQEGDEENRQLHSHSRQHRRRHRHHHHHHHHHRHRRHHDHHSHDRQAPNPPGNLSQQEEAANETSIASRCSLEPRERSSNSARGDSDSTVAPDRRKRDHNHNHHHHRHHHHKHHHHRSHGHHRSRCSCRSHDEETQNNLGEPAAAAIESTNNHVCDNAQVISETFEGVRSLPARSIAFNGVGGKEFVQKTCSAENGSKPAAMPLGSILKTTLSINDDGALEVAKRKKLTVMSFIRGGSLRSQRTEKKRVSIVSPHHSR